MFQCPDCYHYNKEGILFCDDCGASLGCAGYDAHATLDMKFNVTKPEFEMPHQRTEIASNGVIYVQVRGAAQLMPLDVTSSVTLGRHDPDQHQYPDIDLIPYGGREKGVSRFHAQFDRYEHNIYITDLGSTNGTYLNGDRLQPNEAYMLRDGDEIRFAKLSVTVYFKALALAS